MRNKRKTYFLSLLLTNATTVSLWAETSDEAVRSSQVVVENTVLWLGVAIIAVSFLAIVRMIDSLMQTQRIRLLQEYNPALLKEAGIRAPKESFWKYWYKKLTNVVPIEKERDIMLDHNYDGIQELDNSLPPWWLAVFYITIAIAPVYIYYNHFSDYALSQAEEYQAEVKQAAIDVREYLSKQSNLVDEKSVTVITDELALSTAATIYQTNCAACHGMAGEGGVGPNLTDEYWIHGGGVRDIFVTIKYGVPEKGMIAWKSQIRPSAMQSLASYILTLKGTNPPNPKAPQGEIWVAPELEATEDGE